MTTDIDIEKVRTDLQKAKLKAEFLDITNAIGAHGNMKKSELQRQTIPQLREIIELFLIEIEVAEKMAKQEVINAMAKVNVEGLHKRFSSGAKSQREVRLTQKIRRMRNRGTYIKQVRRTIGVGFDDYVTDKGIDAWIARRDARERRDAQRR